MANFKKHRDVSIIIAIILSIIIYLVEGLNIIEIITLIIIGTISGFLPDLDHHKSIPNKTTFNIISIIS